MGLASNASPAAARRHSRSYVLLCVLITASMLLGVPAASASVTLQRPHVKHHRRHHRRRHHTKRHVKSQVTHPAAQATASPPPPGLTPPVTCANANTPATSASAAVMDAAVVCLINRQRVGRGLPALTESAELDRSAQSWNDNMIATGDFTHGSDFAGRISAVGYDWQTAGENIATGYLTPDQVVSAWMASTGHCQNILDPSFRNVGTGETPAPVGNWASGPATWTQDFGLLMTQSPLSSDTGPQNGCPYN